jgi:hypothetical protein
MISVGNKILIPKKETFEGFIRFWSGTNPTSGVSLRTNYTRQFGQKFEIPTSGSYLLDYVGCYRNKYNLTSGTLYCAIYSDDNGVPGSELHRVSVSASSVGTSVSYGRFYFSDVYLNGKTPYWIVFYPSFLYDDKYFNIMQGMDATGNTFPIAKYSLTDGWTIGGVGAWQYWLAGSIYFTV